MGQSCDSRVPGGGGQLPTSELVGALWVAPQTSWGLLTVDPDVVWAVKGEYVL